MKPFAPAITTIILMCLFTSYKTSNDYISLIIESRVYWLASSSVYSQPEGKTNCAQLNAELALFENNEEYFRVYSALSQNHTITLQEVWIDFNFNISNHTYYYDFGWRQEIFNGSVWTSNEPDENCKNISRECCARLKLKEGLKDHDCSSDYSYLCRAVCPLHDNCLLKQRRVKINSSNCSTGYIFNSTLASCVDVNECETNTSMCTQSCLNTNGSYTCACHDGYTAGNDTYSCQDIDECLTNNASCLQVCENSAGSFQCKCHDGYYLGLDNKTCLDVNECSSGAHKCQQNCSNTNGSYICECESGYLRSSDGFNCTKVETCLTSQCEQNCSNTSTGYTCHCYPGFKLDADGIHCSDINECNQSTCTNCSYTNVSNSCPSHCNVSSNVCDQVCDNVNGSFQCSCRPGYLLDIADNKTCNDIDECSLNSSLCEVSCINTPGSYFCSCPQGYQLSGNNFSCEKNTLANYCPCSCLTTKIKDHMNKEQLAVYLESLTKSLQVSKGDLLSHRSTLTTQKDDRPTSSILGYIGIVTMTFVFGTIILPEVLMLTVEVIHKIRNLF
ncbi:fibrillin-2 [Biomphalaria glabrata]